MIPSTLLLIGHGSRSAQWNREIANIVLTLREIKHPSTSFREIDFCYMEHGKPSIPEAICRWTDEMHQDLVALPLFLSVSEHVLKDIPNELSTTATFHEKTDSFALYKRGNHTIHSLEPPETSGLIASNCSRRFNQLGVPQENTAILLVYYGSSQHGEAWAKLSHETMAGIRGHLPNLSHIDFVYGGHVVDFSPQPIREKIDQLAKQCERIVILPALVSVGVIQTDVIPSAIEQCHSNEKVIYPNDAILPDAELAKNVLAYAEEKSLNLYESAHL